MTRRPFRARKRPCRTTSSQRFTAFFAEHEDRAGSAAERVRYLMVDEYQNTHWNKLLPRYAPLEKT